MTESKTFQVVAVCGDPGGANAVAPVIEVLCNDGRVSVQALAYREARDMWAKRGFDYQELATSIDSDSMAGHLRGHGTVLLLMGTSFNSIDLEKGFTAQARAMGIPSLAVLDFWSNYAVRFSGQEKDLAYVPDRIAVMDDWAVKEMVDEGFDPSCLLITGQPAHDDLVKIREEFSAKTRKAKRLALGVAEGGLLVLFASQPLYRLYGTGPQFSGYDERTVVSSLVEALENIAQRSGRDITLAIRPHPRELPDGFRETRSQRIHIVIDTEGESRDLAMSADVVTGMTTVLLVEACYLGCVTVSLQPGMRGTDALPTNRLGLSYPAYSDEEVEPVVEKMLMDQSARSAAQARLEAVKLDDRASQRVARLVYQMIGLESEE